MKELTNLSLDEIINGYIFDKVRNKYICNMCGMEFEDGEVFKLEGRYFTAEKMIKTHIEKEHETVLDYIMSFDKKLTGITENQKQLLKYISQGMTDAEIAKLTNVAAATIRHQKFIFREKVKQAKLYLAIYELAFKSAEINNKFSAVKEDLLFTHLGAKMVDERYVTTREEEEKILASSFSSLFPLKLISFPAREKKKIVILKKIAGQFETNRRYHEKEVNAIIKEIYNDFATIRRYLIEYGFMERTVDCKYYWIKG